MKRFVAFLILVSILISMVPFVSAASAPAISAPFTTHPSVFMVEDTYQIAFATNATGLAWVEIAGQRFDDATSGLMNWNSKYHKITVPQAVLNAAKSYKICFQKLTDRLPYDTVPGSTNSRTYPFEPAGTNPVFLCLSDQHSDIDDPAKVASYQDYDIYVSVGDYSGKLTAETEVKLLLDQTGTITKGMKPTIYTRGNHETRGAFSHELQRVAPFDEETGLYYTVAMPGIFGIVLDAGEDKDDSHAEYGGTVDFEAYRKEQTDWLKGILASRQWEKYPVRMAFCHIPFSFYNAEDFQSVYKDWTSILNQMGISLMISGHTHKNAIYAPSATRYKYPANFTTVVVSDRANGDYAYSGSFVSVKDKNFEIKTVLNTLAVKSTTNVPILDVPTSDKVYETVGVTTPAKYKTSSTTPSVPTLTTPFTKHPTVFAVEDSYEIVFPTNATGMAWVEVGGAKYCDSTTGIMNWASKYHKIRVPRITLDVAKSYKICFQSVETRAAYSPVHGDTVSLTYPFKPIANKADPTFLCLSDCRSLTTEAQNVASYQDFDAYYIGGDYATNGDSEAKVTSLLDICAAATSGTKPVIFTRGNREVRGEYSYLLEQITPSKSYYDVKLHDIYAIVLDSGEDKVDSNSAYGGTISYEKYRAEQTEWLRKIVASGEWKNYPTRIAFCHIPFTIVTTASFKQTYAEWTELLDQMGVSLLITGHNHTQKLYKPTDTAHVSDPAFNMLVVSNVENTTATYSGSYVTIGTNQFTIKSVSSDKKVLSTTTATNFTAKNFWNNPDEFLFFDFNNDSVAHKRYANAVYGELNHDTAWANETNTSTATVSGGVMSFTPVADTTATSFGVYSRPVGTKASQWDHKTLHYVPKANDYCQVRLKIDGATCTATNGLSKLRIDLDCPNDIDDSADTTKTYWRFEQSFELAKYVDKGYFTVEIPLNAAEYQKMNWVNLVHPQVVNIASATGKTATISIDYIYIGPKATFPTEEQSVFFDFTDTEADLARYDSHTYNYTNYDNAANWTTYNGTAVLSMGDGALQFTIPEKATSTNYTARTKTFYPNSLHYIPKNGDYIEVRLKVENAAATSTDGEINFRMDLDRPNTLVNASGTSRTWTNIFLPFTLSEVLDKGYFVLNQKLTDAEYLASDWINVVHPNFGNIKAAAGKTAKLSIDYIYIGPQEGLPSKNHTVTFCAEDGTVLEEVTVFEGNGVTYSGETPTKAPVDTCHYVFAGWVDEQETLVDLNTVTSAMKLYAKFAEQEHEYDYTKVDENNHNAACECGYQMNENHAWDDGQITSSPTCTENGVMSYACRECEATMTEAVSAKGHIETIDPAVAPSCTQTGLTEGSHCATCGAILVAQQTVATVGHSYYAQVIEPTCTAEGYTLHTCAVCGDNYRSDSTPKLEHDYDSGTVTLAPTCTASGVRTYLCTACGAEKTESVPNIGHTPTTDPYVAPTCTEEGRTEGSHCAVCSAVLVEQKLIEMIGHEYNEGVVTLEPTCLAEGVKTFSCHCGNSYTEPVAKLAHTLSEREEIAATCVENGRILHYICMQCETLFIDEYATYRIPESYVVIEATGHTILAKAEIAPTCTTAGMMSHYACIACEKAFADADGKYEIPLSYLVLAATGHAYVYTEAADVHTVACKNCAYNVKENHDFVDGFCTCGAAESTDPIPDASLKFNMDIVAGAEMVVNYNFMATVVSKYTDFYLEVSKDVVGGEPIVTTFGVSEGHTSIGSMNHPATGAPLMYNAAYNGINAKEMGDSFATTLYAIDANGKIYKGETVVRSIKDYLLGKLEDANSIPELKTMAVYMLKYGAAAQVNFDYDVENLVTNDLTEEQLSLATQEIPEAVDYASVTGTGANVNTNITVNSKVELSLSCIAAGQADPAGVKCVITDKGGKVLAELTTTNMAGIMYSAKYDNVGASQMREVITATFYNAEGVAISKTVEWSVESYVAQTRARDTATETEIAMVDAMLTYGDSVAAYMAVN